MIASLIAAPTPEPSSTTPSCTDDPLCQLIMEQTQQVWLAESSYYVLIKPALIVAIIVAALILRRIVFRMINRLAAGVSEGRRQAPTKPVQDRATLVLADVTGVRSERRRQRAQALGSVLRSGATITIFSVAAMLVLGELGVELAPLLASAGIAGVAVGFGAQNLVKDFIAGLFMLLEDQYGVGDTVDLGEVSGDVEAVGLRITTVRDDRGVLWYIRNGEISRVGNQSQGWSMIVVDIQIGFANVDEATAVLQAAADAIASDPQFADDLIESPAVLGVEHISAEGAVIRVTAKTTAVAQGRVGRELRRRLSDAVEASGLSRHAAAALALTRGRGNNSAIGAATAAAAGAATGAATAVRSESDEESSDDGVTGSNGTESGNQPPA